MTAKHTPGPWSVQDGDRVFGYSTGKPYSHCLHEGIGYKTEREANARLIAAAPELLAALEGAEKALIKALPHLPADSEAVYCGEWLVEIRAAIAKAKGGA